MRQQQAHDNDGARNEGNEKDAVKKAEFKIRYTRLMIDCFQEVRIESNPWRVRFLDILAHGIP